jgi:hypothetical protein
MLATVMRHTGRFDEARRELARLEQLERSEKWRLEIKQEHERISRLVDEGPGDGSLGDGSEDAIDVISDVAARSAEASEAA